MRRVMIVGQPGSGKSTLARALGARTGLPVVHIDRIHWRSGWIERSQEEKSRLCREVEARDDWVVEGGHSATWDTRVARADLLVWLDRPVGLRLWRVLRRSLTDLGRTRPDLPEGCPEQIRNLPRFLTFIWRTRRTAHNRLAQLAAQAPCPVVRLRTNREVAGFLAGLEAFDPSGPGKPRPC